MLYMEKHSERKLHAYLSFKEINLSEMKKKNALALVSFPLSEFWKSIDFSRCPPLLSGGGGQITSVIVAINISFFVAFLLL